MDNTNEIVTNPIVNQSHQEHHPIEANEAINELSTKSGKDVDNQLLCGVCPQKPSFPTIEELMKHIKETHKHAGGRPCSFCKNPEVYLQKVQTYTAYCNGKIDGKLHVPFLEELCDYDYMDMEIDTLEDWMRNIRPMPHDPNHKAELHEKLSLSIKKLKQKQKLLLLRRTLAMEGQVIGAIFQLKANHGMVETEKRLLGQDKDSEALQIEIIGEDRKKYVEED